MNIMGTDYMDRLHAMRRANDIQAMAAEIAGHIPRMWLSSPSPVEFWQWYGGELDSVLRNAPTDMERQRLRSSMMKALERSGIPDPPKSL